jgi:hypothetical protein
MQVPILNWSLLTLTEKGLNVLGWVPFVSSLSGAFRMVVAKVMIVTTLILAAAEFMIGYLSSRAYRLQSHKCYLMHGVGNWVRGSIESFPFIGNLLCFIYDLSHLRLQYPNPL